MFVRDDWTENRQFILWLVVLRGTVTDSTCVQKDQEQTEQLATKVRTLTYDTERLESLLRETKGRADNMEREMEMFKARWT